jgi:hypothetical protein
MGDFQLLQFFRDAPKGLMDRIVSHEEASRLRQRNSPAPAKNVLEWFRGKSPAVLLTRNTEHANIYWPQMNATGRSDGLYPGSFVW